MPVGGDAYLLSRILLGWDDAHVTAILKNIHQALAKNGKVLILEEAIPPGDEPGWATWMDLNILVIIGGRGRTENEFRTLLGQAGFELSRMIPTESPVYVIEGVRV